MIGRSRLRRELSEPAVRMQRRRRRTSRTLPGAASLNSRSPGPCVLAGQPVSGPFTHDTWRKRIASGL